MPPVNQACAVLCIAAADAAAARVVRGGRRAESGERKEMAGKRRDSSSELVFLTDEDFGCASRFIVLYLWRRKRSFEMKENAHVLN